MDSKSKNFAEHMARTQMHLPPIESNAGNLFSERTNTENARKYKLFPNKLSIQDWVDHTFLGRLVNPHADRATNGNLEFNVEFKNYHITDFAKKNSKAIQQYQEAELSSQTPIDFETFKEVESDGIERFLVHLTYEEIRQVLLLSEKKDNLLKKYQNYSVENTKENKLPEFNPFEPSFQKSNKELNNYLDFLKVQIKKREIGLLVLSAKYEELMLPWTAQALKNILIGSEVPSVDLETMNKCFNFSRKRNTLLDEYSDYSEEELSQYRTNLALKKQEVYVLAEAVFSVYAGDEAKKNEIQREIQRIFDRSNDQLDPKQV
ncbi:MAG: hypothetical protein ACRCXZ_03495 [Patescibacteria group bacterium]